MHPRGIIAPDQLLQQLVLLNFELARPRLPCGMMSGALPRSPFHFSPTLASAPIYLLLTHNSNPSLDILSWAVSCFLCCYSASSLAWHLGIELSAGRNSSSFSNPLFRILTAILLTAHLPGVRADCWIDSKFVASYQDSLPRHV